LQRLRGQRRVAGKLRKVGAALRLQPRLVCGDDRDGRHRRVADRGREIDEIVEHLLWRGVEDAVAEHRLEASRFDLGVMDRREHAYLSAQRLSVLIYSAQIGVRTKVI